MACFLPVVNLLEGWAKTNDSDDLACHLGHSRHERLPAVQSKLAAFQLLRNNADLAQLDNPHFISLSCDSEAYIARSVGMPEAHTRKLLPGMLSCLYHNGESLCETILHVTRGTPVELEVADRLISPADSLEYSELLLRRSFVALNLDAPPIKDNLRLQQQSTQAEASETKLVRLVLRRVLLSLSGCVAGAQSD